MSVVLATAWVLDRADHSGKADGRQTRLIHRLFTTPENVTFLLLRSKLTSHNLVLLATYHREPHRVPAFSHAPQRHMKNSKSTSQQKPATVDARALIARAVAAEMKADRARHVARAAKVRFKAARKAFKLAKKAARQARKAAARALETKPRKPAQRKPAASARTAPPQTQRPKARPARAAKPKPAPDSTGAKTRPAATAIPAPGSVPQPAAALDGKPIASPPTPANASATTGIAVDPKT